jgi:hypothetical protein
MRFRIRQYKDYRRLVGRYVRHGALPRKPAVICGRGSEGRLGGFNRGRRGACAGRIVVLIVLVVGRLDRLQQWSSGAILGSGWLGSGSSVSSSNSSITAALRDMTTSQRRGLRCVCVLFTLSHVHRPGI